MVIHTSHCQRLLLQPDHEQCGLLLMKTPVVMCTLVRPHIVWDPSMAVLKLGWYVTTALSGWLLLGQRTVVVLTTNDSSSILQCGL